MTTTTQTTPLAQNGYRINPKDRLVTVCAWCFPARTCFEKVPALATWSHYGVTHSICTFHQAQLDASIRNSKFKFTTKSADNINANLRH